MQYIAREALGLLKEGAPHLILAVDAAATSPSKKLRAIETSLDEFAGDVMLFYSFAWYAHSSGVRIVLQPGTLVQHQ